jgi:hypothetical protein
MHKNTHGRRKHPAAALAALLVLAPAIGFAQDAPPKDPNELEVVTVTGSRIKRPNIESASPVTAITTQELVYQGTTSVETALNRLPQFTADSNENGSNGSDGTARLNLRGLGSNRVLVLVDGQRMLPVETADVNFIPSSLLERVDVKAWQAIKLPRAWDDPAKKPDAPPDRELKKLFQRVRAAAYAWKESLDHLATAKDNAPRREWDALNEA